jgi:hypothetical protein
MFVRFFGRELYSHHENVLSYEEPESWKDCLDSMPRTMNCQIDILMLLNVTQQAGRAYWPLVRLWEHESSQIRKSDPDGLEIIMTMR